MSQAVKVAQVEEWDSDESAAVSGTVVQAQRNERPSQPSPRPAKASESRRRREAPVDSGHPPKASAPSSGKPQAPERILPPAQRVVQRPATASPTKANKSKPIIHRNDSARDQRAQTVSSSSATRRGAQCNDRNCRDPNCGSTRENSRRSTITQQQPQTSAYAGSYAQYPVAMAPAPARNMMMPPPPRPRTASTSRASRPVSIHGYSGLSYNGVPTGPPPSASAYYGYPSNYPPAQSAGYYGSTPPTQQSLEYPPSSPVVPPSPTLQTMTTYPGFPGYAGGLSARAINTNVPGLDMPQAVQPSSLARTMSARRPSERRDSRIYQPEPPQSDYESTSSESSESEPEPERRHHRRRSSRRDSHAREEAVAVVHRPRRPTVEKKYYTETSVPTTTHVRREPSRRRESLRRAPQSEPYLEYPSSSDRNDSDRTQDAVIYRRPTASSTHSSRRPSVSTTASSGRTKNTSLSSNTDYSKDYAKVILEGPNGRRTAYLSKEQQVQLARRYERQTLDDPDPEEEHRMKAARIAAYQRQMAGGEPQELTAENIKKSQYRKSASHVSGRSQKSSGSGSKTSKTDNGIKIQSGDTVLHVYGDAKVEMRPGEDGRPAQFFIASSSGRDSAYHTMGSSKSSGSRIGRSRGRSEMLRRERIPESEYEPAL